MITRGKWKAKEMADKTWIISSSNGQCPAMVWDYAEAEANANLIVAAVNACTEINPDNPVAVAEALPGLIETLKNICDFMYNYSGNEQEVNSQDYSRFKEKYLLGYEAIAKAVNKEPRKKQRHE